MAIIFLQHRKLYHFLATRKFLSYAAKKIFRPKGGIFLCRKYSSRAQTLLEYVIIIGIVTLVLMAMAPRMKRGIQAIIKVTADQMAVQEDSDQTADREAGHLVRSYTNTDSFTQTQIIQREGNVTQYIYGPDDAVTKASSRINLGFTNSVFSY